jgi:hypothetical protein
MENTKDTETIAQYKKDLLDQSFWDSSQLVRRKA